MGSEMFGHGETIHVRFSDLNACAKICKSRGSHGVIEMESQMDTIILIGERGARPKSCSALKAGTEGGKAFLMMCHRLSQLIMC